MHPSRAASLFALLGAVLLLAALALRGLSLMQALALVRQPPPLMQGSLAALGDYTPSEDGTQITFQQSLPNGPPLDTYWYTMPVAGGVIVPSTLPEEPEGPFLVRGGRAYVLVGDGTSVLGGSPTSERLVSAALSPDRTKLAYATRTENGRGRLYVLYDSSQLDWLGEEDGYIDLNWSPASDRLAFISPRDGFDQVFTVRMGGDEYRQLTFDPSRKSSPRWSPDGGQIAYLASSGRIVRSAGQATPTSPPLVILPTLTPAAGGSAPAAGRTDIFLMAEDGSRQRALTDTPEQEFNLAWLLPDEGSELGFAVRQPDRPAVTYYYALRPTGESRAAPRRVYPPVLLEGMTCPDQIPHDSPGAVRIMLSNSGLVPLDLPLILRERARPFALAESAETSAVRIETVTLLPGEARALEWEVEQAPGRVTYLSVITELEDPYPIYEQHCTALNTYLGLPYLPFLPLSIVLGGVGLALYLPFLAQRRSVLWWLVWLSAGATLLIFAWMEISLL